MQFNSKMLQLYAVTDRRWLNGKNLSEAVEEALCGGATCLQFRDKCGGKEEDICKIRELCREYSVPFIVNDNPYLALECNGDGVHIGQGDMSVKEARQILGKDRIIGVTVHNVSEAIKAERDGADYLGIGAVFGTSTKDNTQPVSCDEIKAITESVKIPAVAIGGINAENAELLKDSGIVGVAVVSGIFAKRDIKTSTRELYHLTKKLFCRKEIGKVLSVAGTDCSGGAGVMADIKTITANKLYAMSIITALTAQNTMEVAQIVNVEPSFVSKQFDSVFRDIYPDSVKIGMVPTAEVAEIIGEKLSMYRSENIVIDPVMVATSGSTLMSGKTVEAVVEKLFPLATVVTPNIPEAEILSGITINNENDMEKAALEILDKYGVPTLVKGGHSVNDANDVLADGNGVRWFRESCVQNPNTHGTGCTLSSAIACNLAKGYCLEDSVFYAKRYLTGAIKAGLNIGKGRGPLEHTYNFE